MPDSLYFQLFGTPQIFSEGNPITFSFTKINALLYYLIVNKTASRDEIAGLLWPDKTEQSAKKNLRNAIYQVNKELQGEYILTPNNKLLELNAQLNISSDVTTFMENPTKQLDLYKGDFLKGFYIKGSEDFDLWITKMRTYYEQAFVSASYVQIETDIRDKNFDDIEANIQKLIAIDEFDERNYQLLMKYYQDNGRNGKVIEVYYELANLLDKELGISPSEETKAIYEETLSIVNKRNKEKVENELSIFVGRQAEIGTIEQALHSFFHENESSTLLLKGRPGIGKTSLCQIMLANIREDVHVVKIQGYQSESHYYLGAIRTLAKQLLRLAKTEEIAIQPRLKELLALVFPTFEDVPAYKGSNDEGNLFELAQLLLTVCAQISEKVPIILVIYDLQWVDSGSLEVLTSMLVRQDEAHIFTLLVTDKQYSSDIDHFITEIEKEGFLDTIFLLPLTYEEVEWFIQKHNLSVAETSLDKIYEHTLGVPFYLMEILEKGGKTPIEQVMTQGMKIFIRSQLIDLSEMAQEVLTVVSFFRNPSSIEIIAQTMGNSLSQLVSSIEELMERDLVEEIFQADEAYLRITHPKIRDYIYGRQTALKKRVLHEKIARVLENALMKQVDPVVWMEKVAYHYHQAKQELKALDYQVEYLQKTLNVQYDLFPIYHRSMVDGYYANQDSVLEVVETIRFRLQELENQYQQDSLYQLIVMKFLSLEGTYDIRSGRYHQGIENIQRVISKAIDLGNDDYLFEGYRQMIYYFIQIDNAEEMLHYIDLAMEAAVKSNNHERIGLLLRLKGVYYLMTGVLDVAERLFKESIHIFSISEAVVKRYASNIAAAQDYLAEIHHIRREYDEAMNYHRQSLEACVDRAMISSKVIFSINTGITLFAMQNYEEAKQYFIQANELSKQISSLWKKSQLDAYMALIDLEENNINGVYNYLEEAKQYLKKLPNPRDVGIIYCIRAIVKKKLEDQEIHHTSLAKLLNRRSSYYYYRAMEGLSSFRDVAEIAMLQSVFNDASVIEVFEEE